MKTQQSVFGRFLRRMAIALVAACAVAAIPGFAAELRVGADEEYTAIGDAVAAASAGDTILVAAGLYDENVTIEKSLDIVGAGAESTIVDGGRAGSVLTLFGDIEVYIAGLTVRNGSAANGGGIYVLPESATSALTLDSCVVSGNTATGQGGGIWGYWSTVAMVGTTIHDNTVTGTGLLKRGGGLYMEGGALSAVNSTISGNTSHNGGGLFLNGCDTTLEHVTVTANASNGAGGGLYIFGSSVAMDNSIVAANTAPTNPNVQGTIAAGANNITTSVPAAGLAPLADNGGPTPTHALLPGSPALNTAAAGDVAVDQRGVPRTQAGAPDKGAYEAVYAAYVDDGYTPSACGGHVWGADAFASVQAAVDAVPATGTVTVYAGTYTEPVTLNKTLTLTGVGAPVVDGDVTFDAASLAVGGVTLAATRSWNVTANAVIQQAVDAANAGDTVNVAVGTYAGAVTVSRALTLLGANAAVAGNGARGAESTIASLGTALTLASDGVVVKGFQVSAPVGIALDGHRDVTIQNNLVNAAAVGIQLQNIATTATQGLGVVDNKVVLANQIAGSTPTVAIALAGASGNQAVVLQGNTVESAFTGYLLFAVNTVPSTTVRGGTIAGVMQGVAVINVDPVSGTVFAPSRFAVDGVAMSGFAGAHPALPANNFHAGVYVFTGGGNPAAVVNGVVNNVTVTGTGKPGADSAGLYFGDFSAVSGATMQDVAVQGCTLADNLNRGLYARGANAVVAVSGTTFTVNGSDPFGAGGNHGFGVIARDGATVTVDECTITNPATVAGSYNVYAVSAGTGSSVAVHESSLLNNGNPAGILASGAMDATRNWWGSSVQADVAASVAGAVLYTPWYSSGDVDNLVPHTLTASSQSVDENAAAGATVGTLGSTDGDGGAPVYTLAAGGGFAGPDNGSFSIEGAALKTGSSFNFEAKASYTVCVQVDDGKGGLNWKAFEISVNDVNDRPVLGAVGNQLVNEGALLTIPVAASDEDLPAQTLVYSLDATSLAKGMTINAGTGAFAWTPSEAQGPLDHTVTITVKDNGSNPPDLEASETFTIAVSEVNEAPVSAADGYGVNEGEMLSVAAEAGVLANDTDADLPANTLVASLVAGPEHGLLTLNGDGGFSYTHDGSETTDDGFSYTVNDGTVDSDVATVAISVTPVNDAPVAADDSYAVAEGALLSVAAPGLLVNDSDAETASSLLTVVPIAAPAHGLLTLNADGSLTYQHDGGESDSDSFTYKVSDGALESNVATVDIEVTAVNDAPTVVGALPNLAKQQDFGTVTIPLAPVFADAENDELTYSVSVDGVVGASVDGATLALSSIAGNRGIATVTVTATEVGTPEGLSMTDSFTVTVKAVWNTTQDTFFDTLQAAIDDDATADGDTIRAAAGIYRERVVVRKSIALMGDRGDVAVAGPGANAPILDGDLDNDGTADAGDGFKIANGVDGVSVLGFVVRNFASATVGQGVGVQAWNAEASDGVVVRDNRFVGCAYAAVMVGNAGESLHSGWDVAYNEVAGCGLGAAPGIELTNVRDSVVEHNRITGSGYGILLTAQGPKASLLVAGNNTVRDNVVDNATLSGILLTTWNNEGDAATAKPLMSAVTVGGNTLTGATSAAILEGRLICARTGAGGGLENLTVEDNDLNMNLLPGFGSGSAVQLSGVAGVSAFRRNTYLATGDQGEFNYLWAVHLSGSGTSQWTMSDNELRGNNAGSTAMQAGIRMNLIGADEVDIAGCLVTGLKTGISASSSADARVTVTRCSIAGNTVCGLHNVYATAAEIDARTNWWGDASGPGPAGNGGPGTGDNVGGTIAYSPWLGLGVDTSEDVGFQPNLSSLVDLVLVPTSLSFAMQPGGTVVGRVTDINVGSGNSNPGYTTYDYRNLTSFNGKLYFQANGGSAVGAELYCYDGSTAELVADIYSGSGSSVSYGNSYLAVFNNKLYFQANGNDGAGSELWSYDGVNPPTRVADINPGSSGSSPKHMTVFNGKLYFSAAGSSGGTELWCYDGATAPTRAADIYAGGSSSSPSELKVFGDKLYFAASDGVNGIELWSFDGAVASLVADIYAGSSGSSPAYLSVFDGKLYFAASSALGKELWVYDGVNPPLCAADIYVGANGSSPAYLTVFDGQLYMAASDGSTAHGTELWRYDGVNPASLVADIRSGTGSSSPAYLTVFNEKLHFAATDGATGVEVWSYDGVNPPVLAVDVRSGSGSSTPKFLASFDNRLYFQADGNDGAGVELWRYGTVAPAGAPFPQQPTVTVLDNIGGVASTFNGQVSIMIGANPGGGTLGGVTSVTVANGLAAFTDLSIDKGGAGYTLVASAAGVASATSHSFDVNHPEPVLTALAPAWTLFGAAEFTVTVSGSGFVEGSKVLWNDTELPTTYGSATTLTAQIPASYVTTAGTADVTVANPSPGGGVSVPQTFTIYSTPTTVWVDGSYTALASGSHVWGYNAFDTIAAGIDAVAAGGVVNVASGTYAEHVAINKALHLVGADRATTTINGGGAGVVVTITANDVAMSGFTVTGSGMGGVAGGIGLINVTGCAITGNTVAGNFMGIGVVGGGGNTVSGNTLASNGIGITLENLAAFGGTKWDGSNGNLISGNTVSGSLEHGINVPENCNNNIVDGNTVTGSAASGIYLWKAHDSIVRNNTASGNDIGIHIFASRNGILTNNTVTANANGFMVRTGVYGALEPAATNVLITANVIAGNTASGLNALENQGHVVLASANFWGTAFGPSGDGYFGTGDVVAGPVDIASYYTDLALTTLHSYDLYVDDTGSEDATHFLTIQAALAAANPGDTIHVAAGTYVGNVVIAEPIRLIAEEGAAVTTLTGSGAGGSAVSITSNDVEVRGFTITNPSGMHGIAATDRSNLLIADNVVTGIATLIPSASAVPAGIRLQCLSAAVDNVVITNNTIGHVAANGTSKSASGVWVGDSTGNFNITGLVVQDNRISNVTSGAKGAYGIIVNHANSATYAGQTIAPRIVGNVITDLTGGWAHAIGLEGNTPNALVQNNTIARLTDSNSPAAPDAVGVMFEANAGASTVIVAGNSFAEMAFGVLNATALAVDASGNYWGSATGPSGTGLYGTGCAVYGGPITVDNYYADAGLTTLHYYEVYVDDDFDSATEGWGVFRFATVQSAVTAANPHDTVSVGAGLYVEDVAVSKHLTLLGPKADTARNTGSATDWTSSTTATWTGDDADAAGEAVIRSAVVTVDGVVDIAEDCDVTVKGFVIEARNRTDGTNAHLVYADAKNAAIQTVVLENNVIGPITGDAQTGAKGRFGISLNSQSSGNNGLSGAIRGNKVFGAEGNGANLFIIGQHYFPSMSDYSGMLIESNDVYGANRAGVEIAGGVHGLTIRDNWVAYNGYIWDGSAYVQSAASLAAPDNILYGAGINLVRIATTANTYPAGHQNAIEDMVLSGNTIAHNQKSGVYVDAQQRNLAISDNVIADNGRDGIWLDEFGTYNETKLYNEAYGYIQGVTLAGNTISGTPSPYAAIHVTGKPADLQVVGNVLASGTVGIVQEDGVGQTWDYTVVAASNYWGSANGPANASNPLTAQTDGASAGDSVAFFPWALDSGFTAYVTRSAYAFAYALADMVMNEEQSIPVTFGTSGDAGMIGYAAVRFAFSATGPGAVTFKATDSASTEHTFIGGGYWGPSGGFALPAAHASTTPFKLTFGAAGTYTVSFSVFEIGHEATPFASGSQEVIVAKATPAVTWPAASLIVYAQTLGDSALTDGAATHAALDIPGSFAFDAPATAPVAGTAEWSVTFVPADTANYNSVAGMVSVTVEKATPVVTWPVASHITYGDTLAASVLTDGSAVHGETGVPGVFAFTVPETVPPAGTANQSVTFSPSDAANYNPVVGEASVTVGKSTPTVTTWPTAATILLGQSIGDALLSGGVASVPGTFTFDAPATKPGVGTATYTVTFTPDDSSINTVAGSADVTVERATVVWVDNDFDASTEGWGVTKFATIPDGIAAVAVGGTVHVGPGDYDAKVAIGKSVTLLSTDGAVVTTIRNTAVTGLGTVQLANGVTGVQLGDVGHGFTIVGIDWASAGLEVGAIYMQASTGAKIIGNVIVAAGDYGLLSTGGAITGLVVTDNEFAGQTFIGANPAGSGFNAQFTLWNVPRQLVVIQGTTGPVVFSRNTVSGSAGGTNTDGLPQGNTLVTIDTAAATIADNVFSGSSTRYATALRVGGVNAVVSGNAFEGHTPGGLFVRTAAGATALVTDNSFEGFGAGQSAIENQGVSVLRAEGNWFGDETGPASTANPGATGGAVLGAVDISPWLADGTDADEATMGFQPAVDAAVNYLPTRLEFAVEPSDTTLGAILAPAVVVTVMNENDEPATQFAGSVTLGFGANPGLGELEGTLTVPCTAGVATFADLKVTKGGGSGFALAASAADPILGVPSALFDVANPAPVLTAISPIFRTAGTLGTFTLTLTGSDFVPTSVVRWNGQDRPTAYGTSGQITAQIPQADVAAAGTASVTVYTPPAGGGTSGSLTFTITAAAQAPVVHVDSAWTGPAVCGGHVWGYDAFATVQGGINAVAVGGAVNVAAGTYTEDVLLNKAGIAVLGAGADVTTVVGPIGGASETFKFGAEGVVLDGFTITRAGNTVAEWNLALNGTGVHMQNRASGTVRNCRITGMRTGIDINNSSGITVRNNDITFNRTGMLLRNKTDNLTVIENKITDNWTVGVLFLDASTGSNVPVQTAANCSFSNNDISGNWYGDIVDRQTGGSLPAPGANLKNFSGNWLGTATPVVSTDNSAEPAYAVQIPLAYGGEAVNPGGAPNILGPASANIDYSPWLAVGDDMDGGAAGFKGDPATLWVDDGSPQTGMTGRLQEGVDLVAEAGTVNVLAGTYTEQVVIGKPLNLQGAGQGATIVKAFDAMPATFTTPGPSVNHAVVIVQGTNGVRIADMTIDGDHRGGTNVRFEGIGVRNAGVLVTRVLVTGIRNEPFSGAQHGTGIYGHNDDGVDRTVSVVDCDVVDFQKSGIVLNGASMDALVCGCTVTGVGDTTVTAQNGIQLGSGASGTICHNTVADCYYLSDAWGASGILGASAGSVSILSNTVSGCAGGLRVDNYSGVTGPVVIDGNVLEGNGFSTVWGCEDVAVTGNSFDLSGQGLWLIDSDDVVVERNTFNDCDYGLFVDGDCNGVTVSECEFLDAAGIGLAVEPYGTDPTGVVVQSCDFTGSAVGLSNTSANPVVALNNYWGTPTGPDAATNPGGTGAAVEGSVSFSPWLGDGTDDPDTLGFQPNPTPVYYLPTELVFSQDPVGGMVDAELAAQPIVTVKNERGETATQYNGSVALAIALPNPGAPVPGVLDGDVEVPVVNGVATFSGLKVLGGSAVGYRLVATSLTLPAETSVAFDVGNHAVDIQAVQGAWTVVDEQEPLTFTVTAFDADTPTQTLTFSIDPPSFDAGMRIDAATGAFAWTPTEAQGSGAVYPVTITVTDNGSPATVASRSFAITVAEVNVAPELAAIGDQGVNEQVPLTFTATATDQDDPDQALVFSLTGDVPTGADIDADTGVFTWKPTEAQGGAAYTFMVVVTDNGANPASLADSEEITVTVAEVNVAPVLGTIPPQSVNFGQTLTFTATAADQDEPAQRLSFGLIGAPDGAAIDASTGVFAWTPTEAQAQSNHSFTVTVADNGAPAMGDEQTVSIGAVSATQYCPGYRSPSVNMVVSNSVAFGGALTSLTWTPDLPEGWTVTSAAAVGGNGTAEVVGGAVAFSALPATSPVAFTYTVNVPGNQAVSNSVGAVLGFNGLTVDVAPIAVYRYHSADYQTRDGMFRTIDSREMTRLLGYWRRGAYSLSASGLDGYASSVDPGPGTLSNCHSADYSRDGRISTDEMLLVQMYWGAMGYHVDLEGEDGYGVQVDGPGPSRMALSVVSVEPSVAGVETSVPEGYNPGQTLVVTNTFTLTDDTLGALYWRFQLPNGWGIASVDADGLPLEVHGNEVVVMTSPLPSSVTLVCGIAVPLTEARACAFEVESVYRTYANTKASVLSDGAALLGALDADGDGLADAWAARYAAILGAALDPDTDYDGDRHTVRQEYLSGTDPLDEQSVLQMHNVGFLADGRARVEWPSVAGRVYALERADGAPAAANFGAVATDVAADPSGVNAYEDDVDPSVPHFYRVKLLSPQAQD